MKLLSTHLETLYQVIQFRIKDPSGEIIEKDFPYELDNDKSAYYDFLREKKPTFQELSILLLGMAPFLNPDFMDELLPANGFTPQLGGIRGKQHRGFLPTAETALYILAGDNLEQRMEVTRLFDEEHWFVKDRVLWIANPEHNDPPMSGYLQVNQDVIDLLTLGEYQLPKYSIKFPAERLETKLDWNDLVLDSTTKQQISLITKWLKHAAFIQQAGWKLSQRIKPGYRTLFYGDPGTGKTLTAALIGKANQLPVYRIDLSMVVSKYIGETEKNLSNLFARAEHKNWILFFDEADALFSKRTGVRDAHDKYANQEVAYLLQKIEGYNGLIIIATNLKTNIDKAFLRRFQSEVFFPRPKAPTRFQLWQNTLPNITLSSDINLNEIARRYDLTGANIVNVVYQATLNALESQNGKPEISREMLIDGIRLEFCKEGKEI